VDGLEPGLYRYLPLEHKLCFLWADAELVGKVNDACRGQVFVGEGAVVFIWTVIPYRAEWRYSFVAHKMMAMDAGHLCQNLYLASQTIGAGTCAIGAYNQNEMDAIVDVDGRDEFVIYVAPVGKVK
jgi:SagB-type dehydrogenase family enzyme